MGIDLSIIIPVWNESKKIAQDIQLVDQFFNALELTGELIISDDGSTDNTINIAENFRNKIDCDLQIISDSEHKGKGFAVRSGILVSSGRNVLFMDSGGNVPLKYISIGIGLMERQNYSMIFGSRHLKESKIIKNLIWYRQITSFLFRRFVKYYLKMPPHLTDTQCGFKIFNGDIARDIFSQCEMDGFLFDLEVLLLAIKNNYRFAEFPIEWQCDRDSRLSVSGSFQNVLRDLKILRKRFHK